MNGVPRITNNYVPFNLSRSNPIARANDYASRFVKVVYHSNSPEFIAHYRRVFAQQGVPMDKVVFVLTPG